MIQVSYAQPEHMVTAEHLGRVKKVLVPVWGHIIVGKDHEGHFPAIHQVLKMPVGYGEELDPLGAATSFIKESLSQARNGKGLIFFTRL